MLNKIFNRLNDNSWFKESTITQQLTELHCNFRAEANEKAGFPDFNNVDIKELIDWIKVLNDFNRFYLKDNGNDWECENVPSLPRHLLVSSEFHYLDMTIPVVNTDDNRLVAFRNRKTGKIQTAKIGKIFTAAYSELIKDHTWLKKYVDIAAEKVTNEYTRLRGKSLDTSLLVSSSLKAFQYAYLQHEWTFSTSCMARGTWTKSNFRKLHDKNVLIIQDNIHCNFFTEVVNNSRENVKVAMLLSDIGEVLARCLIWTVNEDETLFYADRMYAKTQMYGQLLHDKLYEQNIIQYHLKLGSGSGSNDIYQGKEQTDDWEDWSIPIVCLEAGDPCSYMDTFQYYDSGDEVLFCNEDSSVFNTDGELTSTADRYSQHVCYNCGSALSDYDTTIVDGNHYCDGCADELFAYCECCEIYINRDEYYTDPDGDNICPNCYKRKCTTCDECGKTIWKSDANHINNDIYCGECFDNLPDCLYCGSKIPTSDSICNECSCDQNCYNCHNKDCENYYEDETKDTNTPPPVSKMRLWDKDSIEKAVKCCVTCEAFDAHDDLEGYCSGTADMGKTCCNCYPVVFETLRKEKEKSIIRCRGCGGVVHDTQPPKINGQPYHQICYSRKCTIALDGGDILEGFNKPAERCQCCGEEDIVGGYEKSKLCHVCFFKQVHNCSACLLNTSNGNVCNDVLCNSYNKFVMDYLKLPINSHIARCPGCGRVVGSSDDYVNVNSHQYHRECLSSRVTEFWNGAAAVAAGEEVNV
jgi:hypothetical protein